MARYTPRVKATLQEIGCAFRRHGKGDHEKWFSPHTNHYFPADGTILSRHTAAIMQQAGLSYRF